MSAASGASRSPSAEPPPRVWPVLLAYALLWAVGAAAALALALRQQPAIVRETAGPLSLAQLARVAHEALRSPAFLVDAVSALAAVLAGLALVGALLSPRPFAARLALVRPRWGGVRAIAWTIAATLLVATIGLSVSLVVDARAGLAGVLMHARAPLLIAALAPAAEELFFRGFVQTRLAERWGARAIGVTALMGALPHLDPAQMLFVFAFGAGLGWMRHASGSLWPALAAHVANNAAWVAFGAPPS